MKISFRERAWQDYLYWQEADKQILKRINILIKDIQRNPFEGIGKPERLRHQFSGFWSRRINDEHRLVYTFVEAELIIVQCRYHYD
ncbi:Txe/YoeB family addiction module toxin [Methyloglobulus sp.]|uniref:Txe/YoeB family addiction module toxin n=1 Tax=Methyloglobulus sp. TaxID=2518622 RepID=UPI003989B3B4